LNDTLKSMASTPACSLAITAIRSIA